MIATQEFVVPKSIPMILLFFFCVDIFILLYFFRNFYTGCADDAVSGAVPFYKFFQDYSCGDGVCFFRLYRFMPGRIEMLTFRSKGGNAV